MHEAALIVAGASTKPELYGRLEQSAAALLGGERDATANMANVAALLFHSLPRVNWLGFYLLKSGQLVLGPFQGKPACVRIAIGKGVCGTAAAGRQTVVVPDVHEFPGHIACDGASRSELVVPLMTVSRLISVLDADSPQPSRFDADDQRGLERLVQILADATHFLPD